MEGGKLASCVAFCARRAKRGQHEVTAQYLWQALHSLTALDAKPEPVPKLDRVPISLSEALVHRFEFTEPGRPESPHPAARSERENGQMKPIISMGIEAATQTHEAVLTATECKLLAEQMVQATLAEQIAPIQAKVDRLLATQQCEPVAPTFSRNARVQGGHEDNQRIELRTPQFSSDMVIGPLTAASNSRDDVRAQQKEERRNSRKADLIAKLAHSHQAGAV
eukprot:Skav231703  [mRNA]  locus=scaffold1306:69475:70143:- [translate_table: standard]